jgi:hypothetical protein
MAERGQVSAGWVPIAEQFPATLAKDANAEVLKDGQTPDAYGLGIDKPGYLYAESSVPAGTVWNGISTVSTPTYPPATATWRFAHNRLWGFAATGTTLYYGAYGYDSTYIIQDLGYVPVDSQESGVIVQVVPFGNMIAVFKADCLYVIKNADAPSGNFVAEYVKQSSGLPAAITGNVIAIDNKIYWANAAGIWAYDGNSIAELTEPIRNNLGTFSSASVTTFTADFAERKMVGRYSGATKFIIALGDNPALYDYSTSGFRFTTRTIAGADAEPLLVSKVAFAYQYTGDIATVGFDVKINDSWKTENQLKIRPASDNGRIEVALTNALACRRFAMRITSMTASLYISRIFVYLKSGGVLGYSNK